MNRFNLKVLKKFWSLAKLYWSGNEKKGALTLLALLFVLLVAYTKLSVLLNQQQGDIISSLSAKEVDRFYKTIKAFFIILVIYVPLFSGFSYVQGILGNFWRRWLTNHFLNRYFSQRAFYKLGNFNIDIDNPDQRISEDIKGFTVDSLSFLLSLVSSLFQVIAFSFALWKISNTLVYILILYSFVGTLIVVGVYGRILVKINFNQIKKEANFRFGLVRIRENSESIAFYQGEPQENQSLKRKFNEAFTNFNLLVLWQEIYLGSFTLAYNFFPYILPAVIIAPKVFSGELEVGKVTEAAGAFAVIFSSLNFIVDRFQSLTSFAASVDRLYVFENYLERPQLTLDKSVINRPNISTVYQNRLALENITLQTPNYRRTLVKNLSVNVPKGEGLLIIGASGCGKSSILRAIAGLWDSGNGAIYRPHLEEMLFLPQKPYMILGSLRSQLSYPYDDLKTLESELNAALYAVNLPDLAERSGGFDVEKDWDEVLSLGEQQRLAFARIMIHQPSYVILDEATSALDIKNEDSLYQHLLKANITFVSVGHRPSLAQYHSRILEMREDETWELREADNY
ncbi:ABC transporter ATP-binding protein/permease [Pleurocapsa sp. FMAR1]|uniref:ABC transporter ATP-binding protein/permease n=1 Tax=Pleurocapsa sp. FMAR1 TaxID=3040204 RepID=UPI0029C7ABB3|nr:ABC transporter ATP-binding protein/permease [Pleurocapsa sp. FMAR1]